MDKALFGWCQACNAECFVGYGECTACGSPISCGGGGFKVFKKLPARKIAEELSRSVYPRSDAERSHYARVLAEAYLANGRNSQEISEEWLLEIGWEKNEEAK